MSNNKSNSLMQSPDKEIIRKVIAETGTRKEAGNVLEWFSSSMEGQQCLSDMLDRDAYLLETATASDLPECPSDKIFSTISGKMRRQTLKARVLRVAAVVIPLAFIIGFAAYLDTELQLFGPVQYSDLYVAKGESARICFQDGSEVYLNADSKIRYPKKFGWRKREVFLEGEAYFKVASNKRKPFVVHTGDSHINVLGTSFNVNAYSDEDVIQVTLDEGKVIFHTPQNGYSIVPGQQVVYHKSDGKASVQHLPNATTESLWKEGVIYLHDTPLVDVMRMLERRYDVSFELRNSSALKYSYSLISRQPSLTEILDELQKIAPVKFKHEKEKGIIEVSLVSKL
ncbi:MAG TPA: anti-sigma factor, partial [Porphyromonadaceae bacterium]|nr:anti-sigma factor [Porphyromonadaceae bacterium]